MFYPERSGCDIIVSQTCTWFHKHCKIVLKNIFRFNAILKKDGSSHDVVYDVVLNQGSMGAVDIDGSIECVVDSTASDIRP